MRPNNQYLKIFLSIIIILICIIPPIYAAPIDPSQAKTYYLQANQYLVNGNYDEAIKNYTQAIKFNPNIFEYHFGLGFAYHSKGDLESAIKEYRTALKLNSNNAELHYNLGTALLNKGDKDAAIKELQIAVKLNPKYVDAYNNLGTAFLKSGKTNEALKYYQKSQKLLPNNEGIKKNIEIVKEIQKKEITVPISPSLKPTPAKSPLITKATAIPTSVATPATKSTPIPTATLAIKPIIVPSELPTPESTPTTVIMPTPISTPEPTITPISTQEATPTPQPTITPMIIPTPIPTPVIIPQPTGTPIVTPTPVSTPEATPTPIITPKPVMKPKQVAKYPKPVLIIVKCFKSKTLYDSFCDIFFADKKRYIRHPSGINMENFRLSLMDSMFAGRAGREITNIYKGAVEAYEKKSNSSIFKPTYGEEIPINKTQIEALANASYILFPQLHISNISINPPKEVTLDSKEGDSVAYTEKYTSASVTAHLKLDVNIFSLEKLQRNPEGGIANLETTFNADREIARTLSTNSIYIAKTKALTESQQAANEKAKKENPAILKNMDKMLDKAKDIENINDKVKKELELEEYYDKELQVACESPPGGIQKILRNTWIGLKSVPYSVHGMIISKPYEPDFDYLMEEIEFKAKVAFAIRTETDEGSQLGVPGVTDRIVLTKGKSHGIELDDRYKIYDCVNPRCEFPQFKKGINIARLSIPQKEGLKEIGFLKVRGFDEGDAAILHPLMIYGDAELFTSEGTKLIEYVRRNIDSELMIGLSPISYDEKAFDRLTAIFDKSVDPPKALFMNNFPAITIQGAYDFGPMINISELYSTLGVSWPWDFPFLTLQADVGVVKKFFFRNLGITAGLKGGMLFSSVGNPRDSKELGRGDYLSASVMTFGGDLKAGLNWYITPDFLVNLDLGYRLYLGTENWSKSYIKDYHYDEKDTEKKHKIFDTESQDFQGPKIDPSGIIGNIFVTYTF